MTSFLRSHGRGASESAGFSRVLKYLKLILHAPETVGLADVWFANLHNSIDSAVHVQARYAASKASIDSIEGHTGHLPALIQDWACAWVKAALSFDEAALQ